MTIDELAKTTGLSEEIKTYLKRFQKNESISFAEAVNESVLYSHKTPHLYCVGSRQ